jgi:hypothetical protein
MVVVGSLCVVVERAMAGLRGIGGFAVFTALFAVRVAASSEHSEKGEETEETDMMAVGIAATLIGAVSFQMGLFYLTNHRDDDMRRYSYDIINATISIFSAVMLFQTCDDLVDVYVVENLSPANQCIAHMTHMLIWYTGLQFSLAYISGAIGSEPKSVESMELNMKSVAVILAHLTGFASINAWGSLQQLPSVRTSPWSVAGIVPISFLGQFFLQRLTEKIRTWVAFGDDGKVDIWEKAWIEETAEAENDVMGLTLSFNLTQTARFWIVGVIPDRHGKLDVFDPDADNQSLHLLCVGLIAAFLMTTVYMLDPRYKNVDMSEDEQKEKDAEETEEKEQSLASRMRAAVILTFGMTFAWCIFFSARQVIKSIAENDMVVSVTLALSISLVSFGCIRLLDLLADADCTGDRTDDAIKQIIRAIGILVGFGWEQCFDVAVEELSESMPKKTQHGTKMMLGLFCVCIITPAWRWHLLPFALRDGWRFGFVIDHEDRRTHDKWEDIVDHLKDGHKRLILKHGPEKAHKSCDHLSIAKVPKFGLEESLKKISAQERRAETARLREEHESLQRDLRIARESEHATCHYGNTEPPSSTGQVLITGQTTARSGAARARRDYNLGSRVDKLEELTQSLLGSRKSNT